MKKKMRQINVRLHDYEFNSLQARAQTEKITTSEVVRKIIAESAALAGLEERITARLDRLPHVIAEHILPEIETRALFLPALASTRIEPVFKKWDENETPTDPAPALASTIVPALASSRTEPDFEDWPDEEENHQGAGEGDEEMAAFDMEDDEFSDPAPAPASTQVESDFEYWDDIDDSDDTPPHTARRGKPSPWEVQRRKWERRQRIQRFFQGAITVFCALGGLAGWLALLITIAANTPGALDVTPELLLPFPAPGAQQ